MRRIPRLAASLTAVALLSVAAVVGGALPAQAHNYLVETNPVENSTVTELPASFSITTNETLLDLAGNGSGFAMEVRDAAGTYYGDGCYSIVDATLSQGASLGAAGAYTLIWQIVSEDGHTVSGEYGFTWQPPAGFQPASGSATPPDCNGTRTEAPVASTAAPETRGNADLGSVLWIGGAILAVLLAALVTFLIVSRRRPAGE